MRLVIADLVKALKEEGWKKGRDGAFRKGDARLQLDGPTVALIDRFYAQGHRAGWERGAYEEQQKEDVEPALEEIRHNLDPNGPEIPDYIEPDN